VVLQFLVGPLATTKAHATTHLQHLCVVCRAATPPTILQNMRPPSQGTLNIIAGNLDIVGIRAKWYLRKIIALIRWYGTHSHTQPARLAVAILWVSGVQRTLEGWLEGWRSKSFNRSFLGHKVPRTSPIKLTFKSAFGVCKISLAAWLSLPACVCVCYPECPFPPESMCVCLLSTRTFAFYIFRGTCNTSTRRNCPKSFRSFTPRRLCSDLLSKITGHQKTNFLEYLKYYINAVLIIQATRPLSHFSCG